MSKKYLLSLLAVVFLWGCGSDDGKVVTKPEPVEPITEDPDKDDPEQDVDKDKDKDKDKDEPEYKDEKLNDYDNDTIADMYECTQEGSDWRKLENCEDTDGDGKPDYMDDDSDGDTIPDKVEALNGGDVTKTPASCDGEYYAFQSKDADANGIPDSAEGKLTEDVPVDTDGDTMPDFCDTDNDGDTIIDIEEIEGLVSMLDDKPGFVCSMGEEPQYGTAEKPLDCDGDGTPDYMDTDSDGDTVLDKYEKKADTDQDGIYDRYSLDSDGDTVPDKDENGPNEEPLDSDGDGLYDFQEVDADDDGLLDYFEVDCGEKGNSRTSADFNGNHEKDLAEFAVANAFGVDPKDIICKDDGTVKDYISFYFELPSDSESESTDTLVFNPEITKADVMLNLDTSGTMDDAIKNLRLHFTQVVASAVRERVKDSFFGFSIFRHYNADSSKYKLYWQLRQAVTKAFDPENLEASLVANKESFQTELDHSDVKAILDGGSLENSGYEALYEIASGNAAGNDKAWAYASQPSGDGIFGGAGFRKGALPIIVHITDAPGKTGNGHSEADVFKALNDKGIRVIHGGPSIYTLSGEDVVGRLKADGEKISKNTNAIVPVCAFKYQKPDKSMAWVCGENKCCTNDYSSIGTKGSDPDENGNCVLAIAPGSNLTKSIKDPLTQKEVDAFAYKTMLAIEALVKYSTYDVAVRVVGEPISAEDAYIDADGNQAQNDTSCFISRVEAVSYEPPADDAVSECMKNIPTAKARFDGKDYDNGFTNFAVGAALPESPKSNLTFNVVAKNNNCVKDTSKPRMFRAKIEVYNPQTDMTFADHEVAIIVPGVYIPEEQVN